jgi:hypothetical protein
MMGAFEDLSQLDQHKVGGDAGVALEAVFSAMHEHTGWCGDIMPEYWSAAYPVLREAMAKLYRAPVNNLHRSV